MSGRLPYFVRDYRRLAQKLLARHAVDEAMSRAVGGAYERIGSAQADLLFAAGLRDGHRLVDVGCGSGRTAFALRHMPALRYHGIDVVPELVSYASARCGRSDWRFSVVSGLALPEDDQSADFVVLFSVLTHLSASDRRACLSEAARITRHGGRIVASFLDQALESQRRIAGTVIEQVYSMLRGRGVRNYTCTRAEMERAAADLELHATFHGPERIGQSYYVFSKS